MKFKNYLQNKFEEDTKRLNNKGASLYHSKHGALAMMRVDFDNFYQEQREEIKVKSESAKRLLDLIFKEQDHEDEPTFSKKDDQEQ